jgi:hypothetical protein
MRRNSKNDAMSSAAPLTRLHILSRVGAGLLGGWAFVWGFTVLAISLLVAAGWEYSESYSLVMMFSFLVYLTVLCWAFSAASLARVWLVLVIGAAVMTLAARQLVPHLVS